MYYFIKYCKEIIKEREIFVWWTILVILTLRLWDNFFWSYKLFLSLAIFCIAIPYAWFQSRKYYYKKSLLKLPEECNTFLKSLSHIKQTDLSIKTDESEKLSMINELVDDWYITNYKHNYNNNTKSHTHRIKLTTKWKKYLEGRLK
jgi:hypothetical protein